MDKRQQLSEIFQRAGERNLKASSSPTVLTNSFFLGLVTLPFGIMTSAIFMSVPTFYYGISKGMLYVAKKLEVK